MNLLLRFAAALALVATFLAHGARAEDDAPKGGHEVVRLSSGYTLITFGGNEPGGVILLIDREDKLVHFWPVSTDGAHSAYPISTGVISNLLVTDTDNNRVIEISADGTIVWSSDWVSPLSDGSVLNYPNDAKPLRNGKYLVCDAANHRIIEMDRNGVISWQYGRTGQIGPLTYPHSPDRLPNGNTMIANSNDNSIVEVAPNGFPVWIYQPTGAEALDFPRDAEVLPNGLVAIADTWNNRIAFVDKILGEQFSLPTSHRPYDVDLLPNGDYLIGQNVIEAIDPQGNVVWSYPPAFTMTDEFPVVVNPTSGVSLFVKAIIPSNASPENPRPAIVFIPPKNLDHTVLGTRPNYFAKHGFIAITFDPDGRGQSTNGGAYTAEDYGGFIHQDGLNAVLKYLMTRQDVDVGKIAIASLGYGNTMAAGALARYPNDPPVLVFRDWEGPASRQATASLNGGWIPIAPSNNAFWAEREAINFMPQVQSIYLREQTAVDIYSSAPPNNTHASLLSNAALNAAFGGGGSAPLVRINEFYLNFNDTAWAVGGPAVPKWVPESLDHALFDNLLMHMELERIFKMAHIQTIGSFSPGNTVLLQLNSDSRWGGQPYAMFLSTGLPPLPPNITVKFAQGILNNLGAALTPISVPNTPTLVGMTFFITGAVLIPEEPIPYSLTPSVPATIR